MSTHKFKVLATTAALRLKRVIQVILFLRLICNQTRSFCFDQPRATCFNLDCPFGAGIKHRSQVIVLPIDSILNMH